MHLTNVAIAPLPWLDGQVALHLRPAGANAAEQGVAKASVEEAIDVNVTGDKTDAKKSGKEKKRSKQLCSSISCSSSSSNDADRLPTGSRRSKAPSAWRKIQIPPLPVSRGPCPGSWGGGIEQVTGAACKTSGSWDWRHGIDRCASQPDASTMDRRVIELTWIGCFRWH